MSGSITVIGVGDHPPDLLAVCALRALEAAQVVLFVGPGRFRDHASAAQWVELVDGVQTDEGEVELPAAALQPAREGQRVVIQLVGDPSALSWARALRGCERERIALQVVAAVSGPLAITRRPLEGKRVLVTRARAQAGRTCELLQQLGAEPVCMPTIQIVPIDDGQLQQALARHAGSASQRYDLMILTSANAVSPLAEALTQQQLDARLFAGVRICAIGPGTAAALSHLGLRADVVPQDHRAEGLLSALPAEDVAGLRVLLPRAEEARELLPEQLRARGALVDLIPVYRTELPPPQQLVEGQAALAAGEIDVVTFTSASTARNFARLLGDDLGRLCEGATIAAIGPVTREACETIGLQVDLMPDEYTLPALVDALCTHLEATG